MGVSLDSAESHRAFAEKHKLPFKLLVDPAANMAALYGVPVANGVTKRMTFLIDAQGKVVRAWHKVAVQGHAAEVLAAVRALAGAVPANSAPKP